jgi:3-hydroxyisobutyrate dehydrogenase-like beta-hydroxyacid dehydrogenase
MRTKAEEALKTALAGGNDAEVERWQRVLDALGD